MKTYRAAVIGCSRIGGFIDNEVRGAPNIVLPYSHGAGYYASDRTNLVACSDLREDVMEQFGERYDVPKDRQYTDYRELIAREKPEIVSVCTQPEQRAEIVIHAAKHGAKAVYAEKAMAASLEEADAMVEAVERNGVAFNLGSSRRWHAGYDAMKGIIDSGDLGALKSITLFGRTSLLDGSSHWIDLAMRLNGDAHATWVQGNLPEGDGIFDGDTMTADPEGEGIIRFENGVTCYALSTERRAEIEAVCEGGVMTVLANGLEWQMRVFVDGDEPPEYRPFPEFQPASWTLGIIEDLAHSLDTGEPTKGGTRVALAGMEIIFGVIESHRNGGARVELPLSHRSTTLNRAMAPRQPRFG